MQFVIYETSQGIYVILEKCDYQKHRSGYYPRFCLIKEQTVAELEVFLRKLPDVVMKRPYKDYEETVVSSRLYAESYKGSSVNARP
jgi:hypothetical protein